MMINQKNATEFMLNKTRVCFAGARDLELVVNSLSKDLSAYKNILDRTDILDIERHLADVENFTQNVINLIDTARYRLSLEMEVSND